MFDKKLIIFRNVYGISWTICAGFLFVFNACQQAHSKLRNCWHNAENGQKYKSIVQLIPYTFLSILFGFFTINTSYAEDSLAALMQRMTSKSAVKIAYKETRILELFDQPWTGSGTMYSRQPELMIREQIKPSRLLMGVKGNEMYYFDPKKGIRHKSTMDDGNPQSLNISIFKALINADEDLLRRLFVVKFSSHPKRWMMTLKPKNKNNTTLNIVVSGMSNQQLDTIIIKQKDGDTHEFTLQNMTTNDEIKNTIGTLYKELLGE